MKNLSLLALPLLIACNSGPAIGSNDNDATAHSNGAVPATGKPFQTQVVADLDHPWALTFLPDGNLLITEKAGKLVLLSPDGKGRREISGVPTVSSAGQGGLMDIALAPDFAQSNRIYFSFSESDDRGRKGVALAQATLGIIPVDCAPNTPCLGQGALEDVKIIFRATPYVTGDGHFSGRIAFSPDGRHLFFTNGERQKFDPAQDPKSTLGKVLRLNLDGTPAADNPLAAKGFHPAVWSYGHRNLLGIAFDAGGRLWVQEMGPKDGDEVNLVKPGLNYGYPKVSNGDHYDGRPIPDHRAGDGFEAPKVWWKPAISPAGLLHYDGDLFPQWKGSLFLGGLSSQALIRVKLDGENAQKADQWDMGARIRDVAQGPDGALWLIEDGAQGSQGRLLKLTPR